MDLHLQPQVRLESELTGLVGTAMKWIYMRGSPDTLHTTWPLKQRPTGRLRDLARKRSPKGQLRSFNHYPLSRMSEGATTSVLGLMFPNDAAFKSPTQGNTMGARSNRPATPNGFRPCDLYGLTPNSIMESARCAISTN